MEVINMSTTERIRPRLAALVLALLALAAALGPGLASPMAPQAHAEPLDNLGVRGFSTCVASTKVGSAALVFDASGSLQTTDPNNMRVPAAQLLVTRLSEMATALSATIEARVWTFAVNADAISSWRKLDARGADSINADIDKLAGANKGFETDYWTALNVASKDLREHAADKAPSGGAACTLLVFLSDGEFEIDARLNAREQKDYGTTKPIPGVEETQLTSNAAAEQVSAAAVTDLCRDGGVADALRADNTYMVSVGLSSQQAPNFGLLQSIAVGPVNGTADAGATCGSLQPRGQFVQANGMKDLLLAFDAADAVGNSSIGTDANGMPLNGVVACPPGVDPCPVETSRVFVLDSALTSLTLLAIFDKPGIELSLLPPAVEGGPEPQWVSINSGSSSGSLSVGDVPLSYHWYAPQVMSAVSVTLNGKALPANWSGVWTVSFRDAQSRNGDSPGDVKVSFRSDISLRLSADSPHELVRASSSDLSFNLARTDGSVIAGLDPAPQSISISAYLKGNAGNEQILSASGADAMALLAPGHSLTWAVPDTLPVGQATMVTSIDLVTAGGISLEPQDVTETVSVRAPYILPTISNAIDFGTVRGTVPATGTIEVRGPGCVWVDTAAAMAYTVMPQQLTPEQLTYSTEADSADNCLSVGPSQTRKLNVTLAPQTLASGELRGGLSVHLIPEGSRQAEVATVVPLQASFMLKPNGLVFAIVMTASLLICLGGPVLALIWSRRMAARFAPTLTGVQAAVVDCVFDGATVQTTATPAWAFCGQPHNGRHEANITSAMKVQAKAGLNLNEPGYAQVVSPGAIGVGSVSPHLTRAGAPVMRLGLANEWAFLADAAQFAGDGTVNGQLVVFVPAARPDVNRGEDVQRAAAEAGERLSKVRDRLRDMAAKGARKSGPSTQKPGKPGKGKSQPAQPEAPETDPFGIGGQSKPVDDSIWFTGSGGQ